jgi:hypothetical protein
MRSLHTYSSPSRFIFECNETTSVISLDWDVPHYHSLGGEL